MIAIIYKVFTLCQIQYYKDLNKISSVTTTLLHRFYWTHFIDEVTKNSESKVTFPRLHYLLISVPNPSLLRWLLMARRLKKDAIKEIPSAHLR